MSETINKYDCLRLDSQLCFPLYACSKEIIRRYKPYLDKLDLTYTQYITMMVLWEHSDINVKELGKCLYLDSGTLTPVLKKLEKGCRTGPWRFPPAWPAALISLKRKPASFIIFCIKFWEISARSSEHTGIIPHGNQRDSLLSF